VATPLSWGETAEVEALLGHPLVRGNSGVVDYVLAADVVYRAEDHSKLLCTIDALTRNNPKAIIIFVHRQRTSADGNFVDPLKEAFVEVRGTRASHVLPAYPKDNTVIYEFCGRREGAASLSQ
jgi:hypothetical protein